MLRTFGQLISDFKTRSGNASSANETFSKTLINETDKLVLDMRDWPFLETTQNITTTDDGATYELNAITNRVLSVRKSGSTDNPPTPVEDAVFWEHLQSLDTDASDTPEYWRQVGDQLQVWPPYDTAGDTLVVRYTKRRIDMTADDYTTGNVAAATNGSKTITGTGTTWTAAMVGRWIQIKGTNGDHKWYKIAAFVSTTSITLQKNYEGTTFAAATDAYTIGEASLISPEYHPLLLWRPLAIYFEQHEKAAQASRYWKLYDGGKEAGLLPFGSPPGGLLGQMLLSEGRVTSGPYVPPRDTMTTRNINYPPKDITL